MPTLRSMTQRRRSLGLSAGLALALVASACASGAPEPSAPPSEGERITSSPPAPQPPASGGPGGDEGASDAPVPEILDFEAPLVGGGTLEGAELAGAPVAVWFWAPW